MSIHWQILGEAGADNALLATVDSGHSIDRILFDCGSGCLDGLQNSVLQSIDHLCFSHFHMDHVSGFDTFFRHNYNRSEIPITVWGPPQTLAVMEHRFRGFVWNLHHDQPGEWIVHEISENETKSARFYTREAFAETHRLPGRPCNGPEVFSDTEFRIEARLLPHGSIQTVGYRLIERDRVNVNPGKLQSSGLRPGPWLKTITDSGVSNDASITVEEKELNVGRLRADLLETTRGNSLGYLTDFRIESGSAQWEPLLDWLRETDTIVCECQHRSEDVEAARKTGHMTPDLAARLAKDSESGSLVLLHLSRRYQREEWLAMRNEARATFPRTELSSDWKL